MEAAWKVLGNESGFKSQFLDDEIAEAYSFYFTMIKMCGFLSLLAISISCLGLLGWSFIRLKQGRRKSGYER
jgi:putative ABC transport system permease protein